MAELEANLYNVNKAAFATEQPLTKDEFFTAYHGIIKKFIYDNMDNEFFMLLCRERYDFTLFDFLNNSQLTMELTGQDFYECCINRGEVISIELTENKDAVEIWLRIDEEDFVFYLFPYDLGVIKEGL